MCPLLCFNGILLDFVLDGVWYRIPSSHDKIWLVTNHCCMFKRYSVAGHFQSMVILQHIYTQTTYKMLQHSIAMPIIENDVAIVNVVREVLPKLYLISSTYVWNHWPRYGHWALVEQILSKCMFVANRWNNTPPSEEWLVGHTPTPLKYGKHHLGYKVLSSTTFAFNVRGTIFI